jgi:hypothetical protein
LSVDPVGNRAAPGDPTPVAGRPGCLQNRAGSTGQPCRLTRLAQKKHMKTSKDVELFQIKEVYEYTRGLKGRKILKIGRVFLTKEIYENGLGNVLIDMRSFMI